MSKNQQMLAVTMVYGATLGVLGIATSGGATAIVAVVGGLIVALGWMIYAGDDD